MNFGPDFAAIPRVPPFASMLGETGQPQALARPDADARQGGRAFLGRTNRRRFACLKAAEEALDVLPAEGESLHAVMSGFYDLQHLLIVILDRLSSHCAMMRVATLSLSRCNVQEMVTLLDAGKVGRLDLLTSDFFRKHDDDIFAELVQEFQSRGQRVAAARSHCKVVTLALDDGRRYVLEGSPNLRTNRNMEQFCLTCDPELHGFYDAWLDDMVTTHEVRQDDAAKAD
jgi:hypothetical protein